VIVKFIRTGGRRSLVTSRISCSAWRHTCLKHRSSLWTSQLFLRNINKHGNFTILCTSLTRCH